MYCICHMCLRTNVCSSLWVLTSKLQIKAYNPDNGDPSSCPDEEGLLKPTHRLAMEEPCLKPSCLLKPSKYFSLCSS